MSEIRRDRGSVHIEVVKGRLRLRWNYGGRNFCFALKLPNNEVNYRAAEFKAKQIQLDIAVGQFDTTLEKYSYRIPENFSQS